MMNSKPQQPTALIVDDVPHVCTTAADYLSAVGFNVASAHSYAEAEATLRRQRFDVVVADVVLEDGLGPDLIYNCHPELGNAAVVFMTGFATDSLRREVKRLGFPLLEKPFSGVQLREVVEGALASGSNHHDFPDLLELRQALVRCS